VKAILGQQYTQMRVRGSWREMQAQKCRCVCLCAFASVCRYAISYLCMCCIFVFVVVSVCMCDPHVCTSKSMCLIASPCETYVQTIPPPFTIGTVSKSPRSPGKVDAESPRTWSTYQSMTPTQKLDASQEAKQNLDTLLEEEKARHGR
jgi:hypothetical protein